MEMSREEIQDFLTNLGDIGAAICPSPGIAPAPCPSGQGHVASLVEAVMGVTAGLMAIAHAIEEHTETVRNE